MKILFDGLNSSLLRRWNATQSFRSFSVSTFLLQSSLPNSTMHSLLPLPPPPCFGSLAVPCVIYSIKPIYLCRGRWAGGPRIYYLCDKCKQAAYSSGFIMEVKKQAEKYVEMFSVPVFSWCCCAKTVQSKCVGNRYMTC